MSVSVTMPRLGESVSEGTVTRWLKKEGERVEADEPLLEVSTDKVDTEIPSPTAGIVSAIRVAEDETVEVGAELATIDEGGSAGGTPTPVVAEQMAEEPVAEQTGQTEPAEPTAAAEPPADAPAAESPAALVEPAIPASPSGAGQRDGDAAYVTPLVRKLAAERGVDLGSISGTGVGGRIRKQDVLEATPADRPAPTDRPAQPPPQRQPSAVPAPAASAAHLRGRTEKLSRLRTVIAKRMTESLQVSAQLTTVTEADITILARLRERAKAEFEQREGVRLSFLPFFAAAACDALRAHPMVNSSIDIAEGTVTYHDAVHLGIAVDTDRGLLVPVIQDAGDLNLSGLARKIADLAERTRNSAVSPDELGGGTFTLTNTGSRGVLFDTPIINQPQVGILGTGSVVKRPVIIDDPELGEVTAVRSIVYLALTYDHRIVDGADAARFLTTVRRRLEEGAFESQLGW